MVSCGKCGAGVTDDADHCFACGEPIHRALAQLTPGRVFAGRYEILGVLGRGGMGMVYRALDRAIEDRVALKVIRPDYLRQPEVLRRARAEVRLARKVRHPLVCSIYEAGDHEGLFYIAMELVEGIDLKKRMAEGIEREQAFRLAAEICTALDAVHRAGVIHRDLKASNVMVTPDGSIRLMDFGIARRAEISDESSALTASGQVMGTPEYMSPEQIRGEKVDVRSDLYSLGVLLFELFSGRTPFRGDTPLSTVLKHLNEPPPLEIAEIRSLPEPVRLVIGRLLQKLPSERPESAQAALVALREEPVEARSPVPLAAPAATEPASSPKVPDEAPLAATERAESVKPAPKPVPAQLPLPARTLAPSREPRSATGRGAPPNTQSRAGREWGPRLRLAAMGIATIAVVAAVMSVPRETPPPAAPPSTAGRANPEPSRDLAAPSPAGARTPGPVAIEEAAALSVAVPPRPTPTILPALPSPARSPLAAPLATTPPTMESQPSPALSDKPPAEVGVSPLAEPGRSAEGVPPAVLPPATVDSLSIRGSEYDCLLENTAHALNATVFPEATRMQLLSAVDGRERATEMTRLGLNVFRGALGPFEKGAAVTYSFAATRRAGGLAVKTTPRVIRVVGDQASCKNLASKGRVPPAWAPLPSPPARTVAATISHDPIGCLLENQFPQIEATISPVRSVVRARVYFKSVLSDEWYYVEMVQSYNQKFKGLLVRPKMRASPISYYVQATTTDFAENRTPVVATQVVRKPEECHAGIVASVGPPPKGGVTLFSAATGRAAGFWRNLW